MTNYQNYPREFDAVRGGETPPPIEGTLIKQGGQQMKAIEVTGKIDAQGNLVLDEPIRETTYPHQVRIIVLVPEATEIEQDPDDTPVEGVKASLRRALQQASSGQRLPLSQMWEGITP